MKKLFILSIVLVLFTACQEQSKRYTQQSPEIETVKKAIQQYNAKNYDTSFYADTCKTYFNSDKFMTVEETMSFHKANENYYSSRGFTDNDPEYEMVVTDDGETWVNCWLEWKGTMKETGKEITMPVHLTYRFADGKIVRQLGYWDPTEVILELQAIEASKKELSQEEAEASK